MSKLSFRLFGAPHIEVNGAPVVVGYSKGIALLAYLAVTDQTHTREALAAFLWPHHDPAGALGEVRRMLWVLNKTLGKGWLVTDRQTVALQSPADIWVDTRHFQTLLNSCTNHGHAANKVCAACLDPLTAAVTLAQNDFLIGFTLPDSLGFDAWQTQETQLLRRELTLALEKLIQVLLHTADQGPHAAIPYAQRLLNLDPLYESAHRLLIALYAATNQPAAAVRQYQECVKLLQAELNTPPAEETTNLVESIRVGKFDPVTAFVELPAYVSASLPVDDVPKHNLPAQITPFVGREFELAALSSLLFDPTMMLITIVAPGGMGKTRLALELGSRLAERFPDGVFFVELAPIDSGDAIIPAVAEAMRYPFQATGRSQKQQVLDYLHNKQMLLILDNFEHLIDSGAGLVTEMLASSPRLKVLVTSRQRLYQTGETLFILQGLKLPDGDAPDPAARSAAVELFQQTARRVRSDFSLSATNLPHVTRVCRLVQGMPLAIVLAAAWVTVLSSAEIAEEIQRGLDILEAEGSELPERMRSIRAVFDHAWSLMTEAEQQVFMKLAVFRGGFTREAGDKVAHAGLRQLQSLVTKALITRDADQSRYHIHELLRQYAAEKLRDSGQIHATRQAHTHYYLTFLADQAINLKGAEQLATLKRIEVDFENVREGWVDAVANRAYNLLGQALEAMYLFCFLQSRLEDGKALFDRARQGLSPEPGQPPHPVWLALGLRFYSAADSHSVLRERLEASLALARERDDRSEVAFCLHTLATIAHYVEQDPPQAIEYYEESAALYRQLNEKYYLAQTLSKLGEAYQLLSQNALTLTYVNEAYQLQRDIGDQMGESETLRALGMTAYQSGDYDATLNYFEKAYGIQLKTDYVVGQASSNLYRGYMIFMRGEAAAGQALVEKALAQALEIVDYSTQAWCWAVLGWIAAVAGNYDEAEQHLRKAEAVEPDPFRQTGAGNPFLKLQTNFAQSLLASGRGDYAAVRRYLLHPLRLAVDTSSHPFMTLSIAVTALLYASDGRSEAAVDLLGLVFSQPVKATSWMKQWVLLNRVRAQLRDSLGSTAFESAWQRGRSHDLKTAAEAVLQEIERQV
ncbi:MAG: tetratricopeptide repeat protein [Anaerolineae bacterium]|nr:tetratricopeptide repeat protein [Anaerolineae bacterium]